MSEDVEANERSLSNLRHELKKWEKAFADANGGKRAGRVDIEKDAIICKRGQVPA